ncbi:fimbrial protein [Kerstersia gyiorum]|uniref:fimbrial protein n=1 Tax=Kerstersia gyiorum TaxID=206506 RepID=UPI0020A16814|nr:fimbrial protein [Kerstersia gyiorum]MCP1634245.1 major type 1 subunit fimbrin (pilin) [Kerstersia gyiorum]MCP1638163.1 major type 1 subunit fimbrin (pilin) [Kerstersia gyiorum]MCP1672753.1 major type 1 subunit fimbrin (pilin) [Kerstersia gyiorum]MCP1680048.1 major type 1 subunit fimbrin (pilin) [Kerstersia gyiorum]MCP1683603.1 major type 1 subunit fimbrin (pilin) [Kerstersia gyiorum]
MKKSVLSALLAVGLASVAGSALADGGEIYFKGNITNSPCSIGGNSASINVPLGDISTNVFSAIGDKSPVRSFDIVLTGCDTSTQDTATFVFESVNGSGLLLPLDNNSTAQGVAIGLRPQGSATAIEFGSNTGIPFTLHDGDNRLQFEAYYESTVATGVTAGTANSYATFTVTYS